ncbi:hypothetical protein ACGFXB_43150 [Streptomyces canus]
MTKSGRDFPENTCERRAWSAADAGSAPAPTIAAAASAAADR